MRLDAKEPYLLRGAVEIDRYDVDAGSGPVTANGVSVYGVVVGEWSTRREAERHAARIRRALKGGE